VAKSRSTAYRVSAVARAGPKHLAPPKSHLQDYGASCGSWHGPIRLVPRVNTQTMRKVLSECMKAIGTQPRRSGCRLPMLEPTMRTPEGAWNLERHRVLPPRGCGVRARRATVAAPARPATLAYLSHL